MLLHPHARPPGAGRDPAHPATVSIPTVGRLALLQQTIAALLVALAALLGNSAHAARLDGDYAAVGNSFFEKISFRSGGKVRITALGMTKVGTYEVDGKEVLITVGNETNVFTLDDKGCVVGGGILGKYCKGDAVAGAKPQTQPGAAGTAAKPVGQPTTASAKSAPLSGKYKAGDGKVNLVLDFKPQGKVRIVVGGSKAPSDARNATYKLEGDKVSVSDPDGGPPLVLTRKGNVLEGGPEGEEMRMTFVRQ